ncbi:MAG TPA: Gfo/Idh/MocA family oxidoreductase, partial [Vicinamibacterales bacterium]|nr:Gfo/Idh/MocA family oxidoreductase [Vicinamibacterales bacterium]
EADMGSESQPGGVTRREFVTAASGAALGTMIASQSSLAAQPAKRRYAIVGTGVRAVGMWGRPIVRDYSDLVEFVGLCDINPLRVEVAKTQIGVTCPTFTNFDDMLTKTKPDVVMVTTVDAFHSQYLVRAMERGVDVMTEKPMVIDETQCRAVLDAEKKTGRKIVVTHNYRYAPKHQKIKEVLMAGEIGTITSVDFNWFLDTTHGADYFRRWHRLRSKSGSLWVHKASHHFDLINWWLAADPVQVSALGSLSNYGKAGSFRHSDCRSCPFKEKCPYFWDITKSANLVDLYVKCESADGYKRDGCVFKEDVDIFDTMNAVVRYSSGVNMSYSVNTFMPIEGYHLAFNGTKGRLEIRDYERQAWDPGDETAIYLIKNFGQRTKIEVPRESEGHGGGDQRLRDLIFKKVDAPVHMRLPDSRAGAMSCLTGIAARKSCDEGRPVKIADLVSFA